MSEVFDVIANGDFSAGSVTAWTAVLCTALPGRLSSVIIIAPGYSAGRLLRFRPIGRPKKGSVPFSFEKSRGDELSTEVVVDR
jgi:hypothetical protein